MSHNAPTSLVSAKNISIAGLVALVSLLATLGFSSPAEKAATLKTELSAVRVEITEIKKTDAAQDIQIALVKQDMGYLMDGIDDLRGLDTEERKAKRRRRRGQGGAQ